MPDDNVVSFINRGIVNTKPEPDGAIITQLKKILAQAESGQLQAIFVVGWLTDNAIMSVGKEQSVLHLHCLEVFINV